MSDRPQLWPLRAMCLQIVALLLMLSPAWARIPADVEFNLRRWTTDDGLPHNSVGSVLQDSAGFMWFATVGGLARYDGREIREINLPPEFQSEGFNVRGLVEESPGTLLVVSAANTILRWTAGKWSLHPAAKAVADLGDEPYAAYVDQAGNVWIPMTHGRVLRWARDGQHEVLGGKDGLGAVGRRISFAPGPDGGTWIAGESLWLANARGELTIVPLDGVEPRIITNARNGGIWIWGDRKLVRIEQGKVVDERDLPARGEIVGIRDLFEDRDGALWISTSRAGLFRFKDGDLRPIPAHSVVSSVMQDREGSIWVGTDGAGVCQLREKYHHRFDADSGLHQEVISSLTEDESGQIWIANRSGGLASIGATGRPVVENLSGRRNFVNVVCADTKGRLWFGGGRNRPLRWTPGVGTPETMTIPAAGLHMLFAARNGDIWFAADPDQLGRYRGDEPQVFGQADGFTPQAIRTMAEDSHGDFWLGGRRGELLRWDGKKFSAIPLPAEFPHAPIHAIYIDAEDRLWIATASGLVVKIGGAFHRITTVDGLPDNLIHELLEDSHGRIWFAARRGLFSAKAADILAVIADRSRQFDSSRLGPDAGLIGFTPTANYFPTVRRAKDGSLWFATLQGAVVVDPDGPATRKLPPPPVLVEEVRWSGRVMPLDTELRLPSGKHHLAIQLAALSYAAPVTLAIRHQLVGIDSQWVDTGADRVASYSNLPPGHYLLKAVARNSAGEWNADGATFAFTIVPMWWETWWFRSALVLVGVGLIIWLVRIAMHRRLRRRLRLLEEQHALQRERTRIARDLHDDLGASLTEVGLLADRLAETAPRDYSFALGGLAMRVRRLATELSGIVWTMNADHSSLADVAAFLRRYAERMYRGSDTRCIVAGVENIPLLEIPPDMQHHVIATVKEALNNVLKHARASEVRVELSFTEGFFLVRIVDNGIGFNSAPDRPGDGNGLPNMRTRMQELGGSLKISSSHRGTQIILRAPVDPKATPRP